MLEIIVEGQRLELGTDTSVSLAMEQPLTSTDKVPAAYTLSFDLPRSPQNCQLLGHPERITSRNGFEKQPARICLAGLEVAAGELSIEDVQEAITVQFVGAKFPEGIRKPLYKLDFGRIDLGPVAPPVADNGRYIYDTSAAGLAYNELLVANLTSATADIIAAPISIADAEYLTIESPTPEDPYTNQRLFFLNAFGASARTQGRGYVMDSSRGGRISKILPAFRVGWMFERLFGDACKNNVFREEWRQLVLVSLWHPKYQVQDNTPVWDVADGRVSLRFADFMPDVPANEFVAEMLKIACASLYVKGGEFTIERNEDILNRTVYRDWNDKVMGTPAISMEPGQRYNFGYSGGDDDEVPAERVITEIGSIREMIAASEQADSELKTYHVTSTGQTFENVFDDTTANRCRYTLLKQDLGTKQEEGDEADDTEEFDMATNVSVLKTVPARYIGRDNDPTADIDANKLFYFVPQTAEALEERPQNLTVALWKGMSRGLVSGVPNAEQTYPYLSHCNYDAEGNRLDDVTLQLTGSTLARHAAYKAWIEKDKMAVKAELLLTPLDLHRLDLRDKFYLKGKYFFIRRLEITMTPERLEAVEAEFIEV
ncbi:hypothetical protein [Rikenella microfusus]|uniref:hypothetical protein n=2 Tax=Rikenella microfusus TaxID=28139 RepID=UPI002352E5C9|nr:hypothetical protein [Rikenella microfusus]